MLVLLLVCHTICAIALVGIILMQKPGSGGMRPVGGDGMLGPRARASFLSRTTAVFATIFFGLCLILCYVTAHTDLDQFRDKTSLAGPLDTSDATSKDNTTKAPVDDGKATKAVDGLGKVEPQKCG